MNILVLNGSPKGDCSITLQTVLYLEKVFPETNFTIMNVGQNIKGLEKDFSPAIEAISRADALLFSYPVYTFVAPCQLHRFIELMKEHGWSNFFTVDILDSESDMKLEVKNGKHLKYNYVGSNLEKYDSMLVVSHFKGHPMGGYGGALKQLSISPYFSSPCLDRNSTIYGNTL